MKNIPDSGKEVRTLTLTLIPTLMNDFEGFQDFSRGVSADRVELARELELEVGPEDATELLQFHEKL